jgi:hypothetical protein
MDLAEAKVLPGKRLARWLPIPPFEKGKTKRDRRCCGSGGDGTIGTVASALVDNGIPFGIIPLGTSTTSRAISESP